MSSSCSPIDKNLKDFSKLSLQDIDSVSSKLTSFLDKSKIGKVALLLPQKYSSSPRCRILDFNLAVFFWSGQEGLYLLGVIQNKHEKFAIKYDNHFK